MKIALTVVVSVIVIYEIGHRISRNRIIRSRQLVGIPCKARCCKAQQQTYRTYISDKPTLAIITNNF